MIREILSESNGRLSSMRISQFVILGMFCLNWSVDILRGITFSPHWATVSLVAVIIGAKVVQKKFEKP